VAGAGRQPIHVSRSLDQGQQIQSYSPTWQEQGTVVRQIQYVDVGTSGAIWGLERGYCMMIGGPDQAVRRLDPIFKTLAPGLGEPESGNVPPAG